MKRLLGLLFLLFSITVAPPFLAAESNQSFSVPLGEGMSFHMTSSQFVEKQHKTSKCQFAGWSGICLIDDKPVFGTDWEMPRTQLMEADVKIGSAVISLDVSCMYNPWFSKPNPENFKLTKSEGGYLVHGHFSDGAGSYEAEWLIIQNGSVRTRLVKGGC